MEQTTHTELTELWDKLPVNIKLSSRVDKFKKVIRLFLWSSASHVVIMLVERYPDYFIINLDKVRNIASNHELRRLPGLHYSEITNSLIT